MYVQDSDLNKEVFYQGDLIEKFPFLILNKEILPSELNSDGEKKLEVTAKLSLIMVLSQTCDVQNRENVIICPVYSVEDKEFTRSEFDSIKKRKTGYWFYLPELEGIVKESVADFQNIYYIPRSMLNKYKERKITSLSDWGRHHL